MAKKPAKKRSATAKRIDEALSILASLNVPREQQNERSALVLLALLGMTPLKAWSAATDPLLGITEMMNVFRDEFGKEYAPNTRETEVWIAEAPSHIIHFNGERFLGPYE